MKILKNIVLNYNLLFLLTPALALEAPKLTLVIAIDQLAYHELQKTLPYLKGGIKFLHNNGINYTNAIHPHGATVTGVGHASLVTGTVPSVHGIVNNVWFTNNKKIKCDAGSANDTVFSPTGFYKKTKSAHYLMADTLADQLTLNTSELYATYALSLKSRASVLMAGRLGKALWFDEKSGFFTSSKAYFTKLPDWVTNFNSTSKIDTLTEVDWHSLYPLTDLAYQPAGNNNYIYTKNRPLFNTTVPIDHHEKKPFLLFEKTPAANKLLLDFAEQCIVEHFSQEKNKKLVLWLSLSSLDKVGHKYGPNSLEVIDMIYHMDQQLGEFFDHIGKQVDSKDILTVLTSDHGVYPNVTQLYDQGFNLAKFINAEAIINKLNTVITKKFALKNFIVQFRPPFLYVNKEQLQKLDLVTKNNIFSVIKQELYKNRSIRKAWTSSELAEHTFAPLSIDQFFKNQLYRNRSGEIIIKTVPYTDIGKSTKGTKHSTPYDYDTHVPLIMYQPNKLSRQIIPQPVFIQQIPVTLAYLLNVPRPSASTFSLLPGILRQK